MARILPALRKTQDNKKNGMLKKIKCWFLENLYERNGYD